MLPINIILLFQLPTMSEAVADQDEHSQGSDNFDEEECESHSKAQALTVGDGDEYSQDSCVFDEEESQAKVEQPSPLSIQHWMVRSKPNS